MPTFPLDSETAIDGGDLAVRSAADVLALMPADVRSAATAPIRDALIAALTEILQEYQRRASQGAALGDVLYSTGHHFEGLAADHEVYKQAGEDEESLRDRLLRLSEVVTPEAIISAVNQILSPFTSKRARYFESDRDQWFVHDGADDYAWDSFVYLNDGAWSPRYLDRLYPNDAGYPGAPNGDDAIPFREVIGAWAFLDNNGRHFVLRLPELGGIDSYGCFVMNGTTSAAFMSDNPQTRAPMFVLDDPGHATKHAFVAKTAGASTTVYATIVSTVELIKGQGMRWTAVVDPYLF